MINFFKKIIFITLILLILFFIFGTYLLISEDKFSKNIKNLFPDNLKVSLRDTFFYIPSKLRESDNLKNKVTDLDLKIRKLNNEVQAITSKLESGTKSNLNLIDSLQNNYNLTKFVIDFSLPLNLNKMYKKMDT